MNRSTRLNFPRNKDAPATQVYPRSKGLVDRDPREAGKNTADRREANHSDRSDHRDIPENQHDGGERRTVTRLGNLDKICGAGSQAVRIGIKWARLLRHDYLRIGKRIILTPYIANLNSPSGERYPKPPSDVVPSPRPLAGRTKLERRLDAYCRRGIAGALPTSDPVGFVIEPMDDGAARMGAPAGLQFCVVCAISGATVASIIAILIFVFTR